MRPALFWDVTHYQHMEASTTLQQKPEISQLAALFDSFRSLLNKFNYLNQKYTNMQCQSTLGSQVPILYLKDCEVKNIPKTYSKFKICETHFAKYVHRCKGKLWSQNQDQHINNNTSDTLMGYKNEAHDSVPIQHQNDYPLESTVPQDFTNVNPLWTKLYVSFKDPVRTAQ